LAHRDDPFNQPFTGSEEAGSRLLSAVERLIDDADTLIAEVEVSLEAARLETSGSQAACRELVAMRLITEYSNRSALSGGLTALPAIIPGVGTGIALVGGFLADVALVLKHEIELVLCLTYLYGYDIREAKERWLAYVMVGSRVYAVKTGRNYFVDLVEAELDALPRYAPRQLSKIAFTILGKLALVSISKGLVRALPLVGVVVGASTNKVLTSTIGWWCVDALERRREVDGGPDDGIVDAHRE
jgi:uncharacterized protein (DUF697 family)